MSNSKTLSYHLVNQQFIRNSGAIKMSTRAKKSGTTGSLTTPFTYFIPAPPHRKNGYREKEFDKVLKGYLESGYQIQSMQTQGCETGTFVFIIFKSSQKKIHAQDANLDFHENFRLLDQHTSPDIIMEEDE